MNALHLYRVAGVDLASNAEIPEFARNVALDRATPAMSIHFASPDEPIPSARHWFHCWIDDDNPAHPWVRFATLEGGYLLDFADGARFALSRAGDRVRCFGRPDLPEVTLRHLALDHVVPLAFSLSGAVVLHAGAVAMEEAGVAIAAHSGCGKSTMVAHLATRGADILADDCLVAREVGGRWMAYPYYQGLRLSPQSMSQVLRVNSGGDPVAHYSDKRRVVEIGPAEFRRNPVPLRSIVVLNEAADASQSVELASLSARDAFMALILDGFFFPAEAVQERHNQLARLGSLVEAVPAHRLRFPRRFEALAEAGTVLTDALCLRKDEPIPRRFGACP